MPTIAITHCRKLPDYETSVRAAGAEPRVVDQTVSATEALAGADGLLLTGGGDVDPALYGEAAHPTYDAAEPGRDAFEIELIARAVQADLPILGICRGLQVLNVARGGTLIQDIPSTVHEALEHRFAAPPHPSYLLAHTVSLSMDSRLAQALGERAHSVVEVNSRHHQAIGRLGEGLVVTGVAQDGVIEAVEDPNRRFLIGVQWHPENFWRTGDFLPLFSAFVRACASRR